jgi:beta-fructofuranosidase
VLLVSLWRWINNTHRLIGVRYLFGDLEGHGDRLRFKATSGGVLDDGPAFYAPHVLAGEHRTLLWGWAWEIGRTPDQIRQAGWAGLLTFPRELFVSDGRLGLKPAAELVGLRSAELEWRRPFAEHAFEILAYGPVTLRLVDGDQEWTVAATGSPKSAARIFVDGSIVETFQGGSAHTTRAYPSRTSNWSIAAPGTDVQLYRLTVAGCD